MHLCQLLKHEFYLIKLNGFIESFKFLTESLKACYLNITSFSIETFSIPDEE